MWVEGFTNQEFVGLVIGLALTLLGFWSYRVEARNAKEAAGKMALALIPAQAPLDVKASAVEEFYELLKDLSVPKIFVISGIVILFWSLGLLDVTLATGS